MKIPLLTLRSWLVCTMISGGTALVVCTSALAQTAPAAMAAAPAEDVKDTNWISSAALGLTLTRGNSKTLVATANVLTEKKWSQNEIRLGLDGSYGEDRDVKNAEAIHGFAQYNRLFTERLYGYARFDALHDAIADVEYRLTFSPGVGYYFIKNTNTTFSTEFGPAFITEKQGHNQHDYFSLRIAERSEHKLNDRVRLWQSVEFLPQVDKFDNYIINAEAGIDTSLTKKLSLRVFVVDTYDNQPAPDRVKNDLKLVTAIAYKF